MFRVLTRSEHPAWHELATGPHGHLRQATWWAEPLEHFGVRHDVIGCWEDGTLTGGVLLRSARAPILGLSLTNSLNGPVHTNWRPELAAPLLDAVADVARRRRSVEVTFLDVPDPALHRSLIDELHLRRSNFGHRSALDQAVIPLEDRTIDHVRAGFNENARRSLRKGEVSSLDVRALRDPDELSQAYATFAASAERKRFTDLRPWTATEPVLQTCIRTGQGEVFGAVADNRVVAAIFVSYVGEEAEYIYGGFLAEAAALRPNHVLHLAAIESAIARNKTGYNLGMLTATSPITGVDRFKLSLGAVRRPVLDTIELQVRPLLGKTVAQIRRQAWGRRALGSFARRRRATR